MRIGLISVCLLFSAFVVGQQSSHQGAPKYAPEDGKALLIMGQNLDAVGGLDNYTDGYVDHMGHVPAGVTTYTGFPDLGGLKEFDNWGAGDVHAHAFVEDSTFDHSAIIIGLYLVDQLGSIITGNSDPSITELGEWIKSQERPVFLRFGYEFDGPWNHYDPTQFKEAWIYLVGFFDKLGIRNVAYVWQAFGGNTPNIERWYPGDPYVNWVGYSHFDEPNPGANILAFAEAHDKPVLISEATPRVDLKSGSGNDHWENWYGPLFERILNNDRIKGLAYINENWDSYPMWEGQGWGDSRVQSNDTVMDRWQAEIEKDSWILSSDSLFDLMDYQVWQDTIMITSMTIPSAEDIILISTDSNHMSVRTSSESTMNGIRIWSITGSLIYLENSPSASYAIPAHFLTEGVVTIVDVEIGDLVLRKKVVFIR